MRGSPLHVAATGLCLLCALIAGGTSVTTAALAQAHGSAKQHGHATKRSGCARQKHRHSKRAKRCRSRHAAAKPAKPPAPASPSPAPAALLSVPPAVALSAPLPSPVATSSAPATTPSEAPPAEAPGEVEPPSVPHVQVSAVEFSFSLSRTSVPAGKVVLEFVNAGQDEHNLHLEGDEGPLAESIGDTPSKGVSDLRLEMKPGSYTLFCSLPTHEASGMKATLSVE